MRHAPLEVHPDDIATDAPTRCPASIDWREWWLVLTVASGVFLVATTELLSLFHALTSAWVRLAWLGWAIAVGVVMFAVRRRVVVVWPELPRQAGRVGVLVGLLVLVLLTSVVAWFAPPNTSDSLSYHMSRVANWAQRQSVGDYPTPTLLQLYQPPWAEFAMLHAQLLTQSERLANFVQFGSMLSALVATSFSTRLLGGGQRAQLTTAVFVAALPVGVLQASSTQNDYVEAMWLGVLMASVLLVWRRLRKRNWLPYAMTGASLGLAICAKGTSYFYVGPFVLLLIGIHLPRINRATVARLALVAAIAIAINAGQLGRNALLFHSPLGPIDVEGGAGYQVTEFRWNGLVSNIVRNLGMQLGTPFGPVNAAITDEISWIHERLGIFLGSPLTTWSGTEFNRSTVQLTFHESTAGNLLATLLIFAAVALGCASGRLWQNRLLVGCALAWVGGLVAFSLVLRWQPWGSRLQLPWFVLAGPIVIMVLRHMPTRIAWTALAGMLLLAATPLVLQRGELPGRRELLAAAALLAVGTFLALRFRRRLTTAGDKAAQATARALAGQPVWLAFNALLLVGALPWALLNETRPLLGEHSVLVTPRTTQMFVVLPDLEAAYRDAVAQVQATPCQRVGLLLGMRDWDYPLWVMLRGTGETGVQFEYVDVANVSSGLASTPFSPCAIVATVDSPNAALDVAGQRFRASDGRSRGPRMLLPY